MPAPPKLAEAVMAKAQPVEEQPILTFDDAASAAFSAAQAGNEVGFKDSLRAALEALLQERVG